MALMATSLSGEFKEAIMLMGRGGGNNGKTALIKLLARTLGQYSAKIPPQLLTGEREKASSPNSAVCTLKGARMAYSEESNKADILNSARLKEVVNPDYISASDKNEKQEMMKIVATIFNMSNYDLIIPTADEGTWRRIWTYIFKVHFKACPDPNDPFQRGKWGVGGPMIQQAGQNVDPDKFEKNWQAKMNGDKGQEDGNQHNH